MKQKAEGYRASRKKYKRSAKAKATRAAARKRQRLNETAEQRAARLVKQRPKRQRKERRRAEKLKALALRRRGEALALMGNRCPCGFSDPRALQIDHVHGGGPQERQRGTNFYNRVIRSVRAGEGRYQLLCANCNWIKRHEEGAVGGRADGLEAMYSRPSAPGPQQETFWPAGQGAKG